MKAIILASALALGGLFSFTASANPIHVFPLWSGGNTTVTETLQLSDNDLDLTISAWTTSFNSDQDQLESWLQVTGADVGVYQARDGLGVVSSDGEGNDLDGGSSSDYASDPDEGLLFVFSEHVRLLDIFVGDLGSDDDINFSSVTFHSGMPVLGDSEIDVEGRSGRREVFAFDTDFVGTAFMLWVDGDDDDVEMLGIAVARVPVPATLWLMLAGMFILRAGRRH